MDESRNEIIDTLSTESPGLTRLKSSQFRNWPIISCMLLVAASLTAEISAFGWISDLACHFKMQYLIGFFIMLPILTYKKLYLFAALCICGIIFNACYVYPYIYTQTVNPTEQSSFKFIHSNTASHNEEAAQIPAVLNAKQADIIGICELTPALDAILHVKLDNYPYKITQPRNDNFGIGLYSRIKPDQFKIFASRAHMPPSIDATFTINGKEVEILYTHPYPPITPALLALRDKQLSDLAKTAKTIHAPLILAGDLNTTAWTKAFKNLTTVSALKDSQSSFGIQTTWPSNPMPPLLTLDHILTKGNIRPTKKIVFDMPGSDHKALEVDFALN